MKTRYLENYGLYPDVISTSCSNSIKIEDLDFRVPCGKCLQCLKKRRSDWTLRLEHEYLDSDSAYFITLTYNDIYLPRTKQGYPTLEKKHVQDYIKRLRNSHVAYVVRELGHKKCEVKNVSKPIRYFAVGEYGSKTRRPHYHILLFNMDIANTDPIGTKWKFGHVDCGTVTGSSINYTTKYMFKQWFKKDKRVRPFTLMSKKPIIGQNYLDKYGKYHIINGELTTRDMNGRSRRLPKAYLQRLFTNKEDRIALSKKCFEEHVENKVKQFNKQITDHYKGDMIKWSASKEQDYDRLINQIINLETL
jgi:hypothetical protein